MRPGSRLSRTALTASVLLLAAIGPGLHAGGPEPAGARTWPFRPWTHARAYTFNFFEMRPGVQTRVLRDGRWSEHIRSQQPLDRAQAEAVAAAITATRGSFETSKCPFPRHAFVYFDEQDQPVASVDVCFECEDLFAWPDFAVEPEAKYRDKKLWKAFEEAMASFKTLFARQLGQPVEWKADPQPTPPEAP